MPVLQSYQHCLSPLIRFSRDLEPYFPHLQQVLATPTEYFLHLTSRIEMILLRSSLHLPHNNLLVFLLQRSLYSHLKQAVRNQRPAILFFYQVFLLD